MQERTVAYTVRVYHDPDGLWAEVIDLPGVFATGDTEHELWECLEEGIGLYLSTDENAVSAHLVRDGEVEERRAFQLCST